jgi:thiamine biosynthesis protein ThiI
MYVVPFGERQREISLAVPQSLRIITYRRVMLAVAERLAHIEGAKALVTGESLGQVASQTLDNIAAVNEVVSMPVLRPLIGSDKQEIMRRAQQIGTHELSSQSVEDCCTLFMPRRPETHARMEAVHAAWNSFDHDAMIDQLVETMEYVDFDQCPSYRPPKSIRAYHTELAPAFTRDNAD